MSLSQPGQQVTKFFLIVHTGRHHNRPAFRAGFFQFAGQLADLPPRLPVFLAQLLPPVRQCLLFGQRRGQPLQLHLRIMTGVVQLDLLHQLVDARGKGLQFALSGGKFFAAVIQLALRVHRLLSALGQLPHVLRRQVLGQVQLPQSAAPAGPRFLDGHLQLFDAPLCRQHALAGRLQIGLQRQQFLQSGQVFFGGSQTRIPGAAAARQLGIEIFLFLLALLDLRLQQLQLAVALLEFPSGRAFHRDFRHDRGHPAEQT